jgi:hypothetical protein
VLAKGDVIHARELEFKAGRMVQGRLALVGFLVMSWSHRKRVCHCIPDRLFTPLKPCWCIKQKYHKDHSKILKK